MPHSSAAEGMVNVIVGTTHISYAAASFAEQYVRDGSLIPHFGFLIPSLVFTVLTLLCLGCGKPAYYAWALAFVAVLYYAFSKIIGVFFP